MSIDIRYDETEWTQLLKEFEFGVKAIKLQLSSAGYQFELETLEGEHAIVTFQNGFKYISSSSVHHNRIFESLDALFNTISPLFRDAFQQRLFTKLAELE